LCASEQNSFPDRKTIAVVKAYGGGSSSRSTGSNEIRIFVMLYTIAVVLIILWLLGLVTSYTLGGFIHILLVIAIVVILLRVISGRRPL
jgi:4-hydroxybenzoate polyprenyltransferase